MLIILLVRVRDVAPGLTAPERVAGAAGEVQRQVEPLQRRDAVVVAALVHGELRLRHRRISATPSGALQPAAAVAGAAPPSAALVEGAARASPYARGAGDGGDVEGPVGPWAELGAAAGRDDGWPNRVGAVVRDGEGRCAGSRSQGGQEQKQYYRRGCAPSTRRHC